MAHSSSRSRSPSPGEHLPPAPRQLCDDRRVLQPRRSPRGRRRERKGKGRRRRNRIDLRQARPDVTIAQNWFCAANPVGTAGRRNRDLDSPNSRKPPPLPKGAWRLDRPRPCRRKFFAQAARARLIASSARRDGRRACLLADLARCAGHRRLQKVPRAVCPWRLLTCSDADPSRSRSPDSLERAAKRRSRSPDSLERA